MKKYIMAAGAAIMALASCSQDEVKETNQGRPIDFRLAMDTRAEATETGDITSFYVTAFDNSGALYFNTLEYSDSDSDGYFTSDTYYYWPASGELTFYSFHPSASDLGGTMTLTADTKTLSGFSPAAAIADQKDFITAKTNGTYADQGTLISFEHRLSQIEVKAKNTNAGYKYKVKGVRLANIKSEGTYSFEDNSWTPEDDLTDYTVEYDTPVLLAAEGQSIMGDGGNAMLIPQEITPWNGTGAASAIDQTGSYIAICIQVTTASDIQIYPKTSEYDWVAVPIDADWQPGYHYIFSLDLSSGAGLDEDTGDEILGKAIAFELDFVWDWSLSTNVDM